MFSTDLTKCHTCGLPTPGHDESDLLDGWLNLCDAHGAEWWAKEDEATEVFLGNFGG
jgi:hypothetical protein